MLCIYSSYSIEGLDKLHALLLQRLWSVAAGTARSTPAKQYQCLSTQYQGETCVDEPTVGPRPHGRTAVQAKTVADLGRHEAGGILAAVATRGQRRAKPVVVSAPSVRAVVEKPRPTREVASQRRGALGSSDGWFLRTLIALIAIAAFALLLTALSELPAVGTTVTGVRSRVASKRLSGSRIDLGHAGAEPPRGGTGISYRD